MYTHTRIREMSQTTSNWENHCVSCMYLSLSIYKHIYVIHTYIDVYT